MAEKWFEYATYMNNKVAQLQQLDSSWTLAKVEAAFKDAGFAGIEGAYNHFVQYGADEDVSPNALFNAESYYASKAANYFNVSPASNVFSDQVLYIKGAFADAGLNAWTHYIQYGTKEGINPSNNFDTAKYLEAKAAAMNMTVDQVADAISAAGMNALTHAILYSGQGSQEAASIFNDDGSVNEAYAVPDEEKTNVNTDSGQTFALTRSQDNFTGTTGDDTFSAVDDTSITGDTSATWTAGDYLDGGAGTDTFSIVTGANITGTPAGATVKNIENFNITANGSVTLDASGFEGLTDLNVSTNYASNWLTGAQDLTAGADANVVAAQSLQDSSQAGVKVSGGKDVTVTSTSATAAAGAQTIEVADAAGAVVVTDTTTKFANDADVTLRGITVTGGTSVDITQTTGVDKATVKATGNANNTVTQGVITVNGGAATTDVTITQDAGAKAVTAATGVTGVIGVRNGDVTIEDVNKDSTTEAGVIKTVTLNNAGEVSINSSALTEVNLNGTFGDAVGGGGTVDVNVQMGALDTAAVTSLALNLNGVKKAGNTDGTTADKFYASSIQVAENITELNLTGSTEASRITLINDKLETLNVLGDAKITVNSGDNGQVQNASALAALTDVTVTNTAGFDMSESGVTLGKDVTFTGGAGADGVAIAKDFAKDIKMGAGNDVVDYTDNNSPAGESYKGTVDGGAGTDTIKLNSTFIGATGLGEAAAEAFSGAFTGFEGVDISGGTDCTFDMDLLGSTGTKVTIHGAGNDTVADLASSGVTLDLDDRAGATTTVSFASAKGSHSMTVDLLKVTDNEDFGTLTLDGAGKNTVTLNTGENTNDTFQAILNLAGQNDAVISTLTLTGNNGADLDGAAGLGLVQKIDASGLSFGSGIAKTDYDYGKLGVTFDAGASAADGMEFIGGVGNDTFKASRAGDSVDLSSGGADTVEMAAYQAGYDTLNVKGFTVGTTENESDMLDVTHLGQAATDIEVLEAKANQAIDGQAVYVVDFGSAIAKMDFEGTTSDIEKLFNDTGKTFFNNAAASAATLIAVQGTDQTDLLYIENGGNPTVTGQIHLVGVLEGVTNSDTLVKDNFGFVA